MWWKYFLARLFQSIGSFSCHPDFSISITLLSFTTKLLCDGHRIVRRGILYADSLVYNIYPGPQWNCITKAVLMRFRTYVIELQRSQQVEVKSAESTICLLKKSINIILLCRIHKYSQLSLSRLRLSRITAYLEEKIWSVF